MLGIVLVLSASLTCNSESGEINQKSITALPTNQKSGLPEVTAAEPANASTSIARSAVVALAFGTKVNTASVEAAFALVRVNDGSAIAGSFAWNQGTSFIYTPATLLEYNTDYRVTVGGLTSVGKSLVSFTSTFKTANDGTVPTVVSSAPANGVAAGPIVVSVTWSEAMNSAIVAANCTYDGVICNPANISWAANTFNYMEVAACGQTHTLTFTNAEDATGTPVTYTKTFTTVPCCSNVYPDCCTSSFQQCVDVEGTCPYCCGVRLPDGSCTQQCQRACTRQQCDWQCTP